MITTPQQRWDNERDLMLKSLKTLRRVLEQDLKELTRLEDRLLAHDRNDPSKQKEVVRKL